MVVVPNTDLLDNHQVDLAEELAKHGYVVHGNLECADGGAPNETEVLTGSSDLASAIPQAEQLRQRMQQWPPINSGEEKYKKGLAGVMSDEMGWLD